MVKHALIYTTPKSSKADKSAKKAVQTAVKKEINAEVKREKKSGALKKVGAAVSQALEGKSIGSKIGNAVLPGIGGVLGHAAESIFKTITGGGDYSEVENTEATHISTPAPMNNTIMGLQSTPVRRQVDQMHLNGLAMRVAHREYMGTVSMTNGFGYTRVPFFPSSSGSPQPFPWLYDIAINFQKWKLLGCVVEYVPTSTNAISGGTPAVGQVAICINYDSVAVNATPTSLVNLLNTQGAVSGRPQDMIVCPLECDPGVTPTNPLYVLPYAEATPPDMHWYSFCSLIIATQGPAAYSNCGQFWISYDIQLIGPYISSIPPEPRLKLENPSVHPCSSTFFKNPSANVEIVAHAARSNGEEEKTNTMVSDFVGVHFTKEVQAGPVVRSVAR